MQNHSEKYTEIWASKKGKQRKKLEPTNSDWTAPSIFGPQKRRIISFGGRPSETKQTNWENLKFENLEQIDKTLCRKKIVQMGESVYQILIPRNKNRDVTGIVQGSPFTYKRAAERFYWPVKVYDL